MFCQGRHIVGGRSHTLAGVPVHGLPAVMLYIHSFQISHLLPAQVHPLVPDAYSHTPPAEPLLTSIDHEDIIVPSGKRQINIVIRLACSIADVQSGSSPRAWLCRCTCWCGGRSCCLLSCTSLCWVHSCTASQLNPLLMALVKPAEPIVFEPDSLELQVHLLVRGEKMRASGAMQDRVQAHERVTVHYSTRVEDAYGDGKGLAGLRLLEGPDGVALLQHQLKLG